MEIAKTLAKIRPRGAGKLAGVILDVVADVFRAQFINFITKRLGSGRMDLLSPPANNPCVGSSTARREHPNRASRRAAFSKSGRSRLRAALHRSSPPRASRWRNIRRCFRRRLFPAIQSPAALKARSPTGEPCQPRVAEFLCLLRGLPDRLPAARAQQDAKVPCCCWRKGIGLNGKITLDKVRRWRGSKSPSISRRRRSFVIPHPQSFRP